MDVQLTVYFVGLVLSLALSAFFAGAETALVSLSTIDLQRMRESGDRRAALVRKLKSQTSRLLATILIGQNLFNSAATAMATLIATAWLGATQGRSRNDRHHQYAVPVKDLYVYPLSRFFRPRLGVGIASHA